MTGGLNIIVLLHLYYLCMSIQISLAAPNVTMLAISTKAPCRFNQFKCSSGLLCIPNSYKCDGFDDCGDNSDESFEYANCRQTTASTVAPCRFNQFKCSSGLLCIPNSYKCDGSNDCGDNSDESFEYANCRQTTAATVEICNWNEVKCDSGTKCILNSYTCDGKKDCDDGSDEYRCSTPTSGISGSSLRAAIVTPIAIISLFLACIGCMCKMRHNSLLLDQTFHQEESLQPVGPQPENTGGESETCVVISFISETQTDNTPDDSSAPPSYEIAVDLPKPSNGKKPPAYETLSASQELETTRLPTNADEEGFSNNAQPNVRTKSAPANT